MKQRLILVVAAALSLAILGMAQNPPATPPAAPAQAAAPAAAPAAIGPVKVASRISSRSSTPVMKESATLQVCSSTSTARTANSRK